MTILPFRAFAPDAAAVEIASGSFATPTDLDELVARLMPWAGVVVQESNDQDMVTLLAKLVSIVMVLQNNADQRAACGIEGAWPCGS